MSWVYVQSTGDLRDATGTVVARGYSGRGPDKNRPDEDDEVGMGPIPAGDWAICGPPEDTHTHGPYVLRLEPLEGTCTHGRSGFLIHGDSVKAPGSASRGCIILPRSVRVAIWNSWDRDLKVIP